jgi:hypothetical protein
VAAAEQVHLQPFLAAEHLLMAAAEALALLEHPPQERNPAAAAAVQAAHPALVVLVESE